MLYLYQLTVGVADVVTVQPVYKSRSSLMWQSSGPKDMRRCEWTGVDRAVRHLGDLGGTAAKQEGDRTFIELPAVRPDQLLDRKETRPSGRRERESAVGMETRSEPLSQLVAVPVRWARRPGLTLQSCRCSRALLSAVCDMSPKLFHLLRLPSSSSVSCTPSSTAVGRSSTVASNSVKAGFCS